MSSVIIVPTGRRDALARYRGGAIEGARSGGPDPSASDATFWLRGFSESERAALTQLPGAREVRLTDEGVVRFGDSLPHRDVPALDWRPLAVLMPVEAPALESAAATEVAPVAWTLVPTEDRRPTTALLVATPTLSAFARTAPQVRLERLRFCLLGDRALVTGTPAPPLPGEAYWGDEDLLPVGYRFAHPKARGRLAAKLPAARERTRYLWEADGRYTAIAPEAWGPLGRDNVEGGAS